MQLRAFLLIFFGVVLLCHAQKEEDNEAEEGEGEECEEGNCQEQSESTSDNSRSSSTQSGGYSNSGNSRSSYDSYHNSRSNSNSPQYNSRPNTYYQSGGGNVQHNSRPSNGGNSYYNSRPNNGGNSYYNSARNSNSNSRTLSPSSVNSLLSSIQRSATGLDLNALAQRINPTLNLNSLAQRTLLNSNPGSLASRSGPTVNSGPLAPERRESGFSRRFTADVPFQRPSVPTLQLPQLQFPDLRSQLPASRAAPQERASPRVEYVPAEVEYVQRKIELVPKVVDPAPRYALERESGFSARSLPGQPDSRAGGHARETLESGRWGSPDGTSQGSFYRTGYTSSYSSRTGDVLPQNQADLLRHHLARSFGQNVPRQ